MVTPENKTKMSYSCDAFTREEWETRKGGQKEKWDIGTTREKENPAENHRKPETSPGKQKKTGTERGRTEGKITLRGGRGTGTATGIKGDGNSK